MLQPPAQLAFAHLNLRYNPFGALEPRDWASAAVWMPGFAPNYPLLSGQALMFMGDQGRGKTTHMRAIWSSYPSAPFVYVGEGEGWRVRLPAGPLVFLDEVQRLPYVRRWWLWRRLRGASLVLGTHEDHTLELERAGWTVQRVQVAGLDVARLSAILTKRIALARRDEGAVPWLDEAACARLIRLYGDDLRAIVSRLYDVFQALESARRVGAEEV